MMNDPIAIVGTACQYPDARNPAELWENILAGRRAFRRLPDCRLRLDDYLSDDPQHPDKTYAAQAALITDYEFDRSRFRVVGSTFRSADMAHWLALDVAAPALADAGFPRRPRFAEETSRRAGWQLADRRVFARQHHAASLALRAPHRSMPRWSSTAGRPEERARVPARDLEARVQGAVPAGRRRNARRRTLEHDRRTHLQLLRLQRRRLHGGRRLRVVAAGRRERLHRARRRATSTSRWPAAWI